MTLPSTDSCKIDLMVRIRFSHMVLMSLWTHKFYTLNRIQFLKTCFWKRAWKLQQMLCLTQMYKNTVNTLQSCLRNGLWVPACLIMYQVQHQNLRVLTPLCSRGVCGCVAFYPHASILCWEGLWGRMRACVGDDNGGSERLWKCRCELNPNGTDCIYCHCLAGFYSYISGNVFMRLCLRARCVQSGITGGVVFANIQSSVLGWHVCFAHWLLVWASWK